MVFENIQMQQKQPGNGLGTLEGCKGPLDGQLQMLWGHAPCKQRRSC